MRAKERELLYKEMFASCSGDAMFPLNCKACYYCQIGSPPLSLFIFRIRDEYYTEIDYILNNFSDASIRHCMAINNDLGKIIYYKEYFLEIVKRIKQLPVIQCDKNKYDKGIPGLFEWLYNKEILKVIKQWEGDPLDSLYYLSQHGYIEKAVRKCEKIMKSTEHRFIHKGRLGSFWQGVANDRPKDNKTKMRETKRRPKKFIFLRQDLRYDNPSL
jgi:hypothetical protein